VPIVVSGTGGPPGACGCADGLSDGNDEKEAPEQPPNTAPDAARRPASVRRRVSIPPTP
jgi:hypothetical protein